MRKKPWIDGPCSVKYPAVYPAQNAWAKPGPAGLDRSYSIHAALLSSDCMRRLPLSLLNRSRLRLLAFLLLSGLGIPAIALEWHGPSEAKWAEINPISPRKPGFTQLPSASTGVGFSNVLSPSRYLTNQIYLNGSGVALGDVDGDGWCDIFFAGLGDRKSVV